MRDHTVARRDIEVAPAWQFCAPSEVLDMLPVELAPGLPGCMHSRDGLLSQDFKPCGEVQK